ncbi:DUF6446 family protein [Rhodobaculum claviforme]|uniref:DUF6446 family protein n=1 Tax=Rhodobaculum claviforme TaxID=1549854 RepID=UPI0030840117
MRAGRLLVVGLLLSGLLAGGAMWWLQVHAFYERLPARDTVLLTPAGALTPVAVAVGGYQGIDSDSSPIRHRACFQLEGGAPALTPYGDPTPLNAPRWFSCFDAAAIGAALRDGTATAVLAERDVRYGIDRVAALFDDGRGYAWTQINACGRAHFDGDPLPPGCPPPPNEAR